MGTQKPVVIGGEMPEEVGGPIAEHHGKTKDKAKTAKEKVAEKIKQEKFKKEEPAEEVKVQEMPEEKGPKEETAEKEGEGEKKPKKTKVGKAKVRSIKYQKAIALIDKNKKYDIAEAIELAKKTSLSKFDGNIEIHIRVLSKTKKPENLRGLVQYPFLVGKKLNIIVLDEKKIAEILKTGKADFDIALATPSLMAEVAKVAKILGPKGKMPNPKSGTVTEDPEKTKKDLEGGQTEYKTDNTGNIHQIIGKISTEDEKIVENFKTLMAVLPQEKIAAVNLCATIGPAVKVLVR